MTETPKGPGYWLGFALTLFVLFAGAVALVVGAWHLWGWFVRAVSGGC